MYKRRYNMKKQFQTLWIAVITVLAFGEVMAQENEYDVLWNITLGAAYDDMAKAIAVDSNNNYIVVGYSNIGTDSDPNYDFRMAKLDTNGNILWNRLYGYPIEDRGFGVIVDRDGNYIMVGRSYNMWIWKIEPDSGNVIADYLFGFSGSDLAADVIQDNDGGYVIAGYTQTGGNNYNNWLIVKFDSALSTVVWDLEIDFGESDSATCIALDRDGYYIVGGNSRTIYNSTGYIRKIDPYTLSSVWTTAFTGATYNTVRDVYVTDDNFYMVVGKSDAPWVARVDSAGNVLNELTLPYPGEASGIAYDKLGGTYRVTGYITDSAGTHIFIMKIDDSLNILWLRTFNQEPGTQDIAQAIAQDVDGYFVVAGQTSLNNQDFLVVKFNWSNIPPVIDSVTQIARDTSSPYGPYDVSAQIFDNDSDVVTLFWKISTYSDFMGIPMTNISGNTWSASIPQQPTPADSIEILYFVHVEDALGNEATSDTLSFWIVNPAVSSAEKSIASIKVTSLPSSVNVLLNINKSEDVDIRVFNVGGRVVGRYSSHLSPGIHTINIPLKPGVYIVKVLTGNQDRAFRLVVR